jgi:predicted metal-dependent peptidase
MNKLTKQAKRVVKVRTLLMLFFPFYGTLLANLELVEAKEVGSTQIGTMATDGKRVYFNPDFVDELYDDEALFVLAHEAAHCANLHHVRRGDRDPLIWNMAGDYVINADLIAAKLGKMPKCGLYDPKFAGWSTEQVYDDLVQQQQQQKKASKGGSKASQGGSQGGQSSSGKKSSTASQSQAGQQTASQKPQGGSTALEDQSQSGTASDGPTGSTSDPGGCGQVLDATTDTGDEASAAEKAEQEADWQRITRQAISVAKRAGSLPAGCERLINELNKPRENWREVLRRFVDQSQTCDYTFARPDRRFTDIVLPSLVSDGCHHLVIVDDTSGSLYSEGPQKLFASEIQALLDQGGVDKITLIDCDATIQNVQEFERGEIVKFTNRGGGGTSFKPIWQWLNESQEQFAGVIYFTDLEPNDGFGEAPQIPVLWAAYGQQPYLTKRIASVPFGDCIVVS